MEQIARETEESNQQELGDLNDQIQTKELEQEKLQKQITLSKKESSSEAQLVTKDEALLKQLGQKQKQVHEKMQ